MKVKKVEDLEVNLLLEAIYQRYGYDFKHYAKSTIKRRIKYFQQQSDSETISAMIPRLIHDNDFFERFVREFSITVTDMFRDPKVYLCLREKVAPRLHTYPYIKTWDAGCATGEEVYSLAILLLEEGLYEKATLFATDFNDAALEHAREGVYGLDNVKQFTANYQQSGGKKSFSEYYHAHYGSILLNQSLKKNITFANHNLVTDSVFGEMHLILCRNVFIYFDRVLQNRVLSLFYDSLVEGGYLCLGSKESLMFYDVARHFEAVDERCRIFRKRTCEN